mgnify:FL=1
MILLNMGANKENYGTFCSLFFGLPVTACTKKYIVLENVAVLVKQQILPHGEEDDSSSRLKNYYSIREALPS